MIERHAMLRMAFARDFRKALQQRLRFAHDQLGNHFVMQFSKQVAIPRKITAIKQRDGELGVVGIEAIALSQRARGGAQLHAQIPQLLRKAPDRIFEGLFRVAIAVEKEQIDVGVGEEPAASESSSGDESEIGGPGFIGGDDVAPQPREDFFDEAGACFDAGAAVAGGLKFPLDARRFVVERTP